MKREELIPDLYKELSNEEIEEIEEHAFEWLEHSRNTNIYAYARIIVADLLKGLMNLHRENTSLGGKI